MNKKELRETLLEGTPLSATLPIDSIYGVWEQKYMPVQGGYKRIYIGASNHPYCPTCGTAHGQHGPSCQCDHDGTFGTFMQTHEVFRELLSLKRHGFSIVSLVIERV